MKKEKKVYCDNCKYYRYITSDGWGPSLEYCKHLSNKFIEHNYDNKEIKYKRHPSKKNEDNKCKSYKRSWWRFWVK